MYMTKALQAMFGIWPYRRQDPLVTLPAPLWSDEYYIVNTIPSLLIVITIMSSLVFLPAALCWWAKKIKIIIRIFVSTGHN